MGGHGRKGKSLLDITAVKSKEKLKKNDWQGKKTTEAVGLNQEHVKPEGQRETETAGRAAKRITSILQSLGRKMLLAENKVTFSLPADASL